MTTKGGEGSPARGAGAEVRRNGEDAGAAGLSPWTAALRHSHERLRSLVEPLDADGLGQPSHASAWTIAQVLSHLGSGAEIFGLLLDAALSGQAPPGQEEFAPIWEAWNARSPLAQARDALRVDRRVIGRFEALDADPHRQLNLDMFGMELDAAGLARLRLGEHALHTWDVAVALDAGATVAPDAVELLVDTLGGLAARSGKPGGWSRRVRISTGNPERHFLLETGDAVTLTTAPGGGDPPDLRLPAEALVRLVYGRLDPAHTPTVEDRGADLDELRRIFPGF